MASRPPQPVVITCAVTGGMTVPGQSPAIPVTADEIVAAAVEARAAGAAIVHLHIRDPATGRPSRDVDLFGAIMGRIAGACDVVCQPTTGGGAGQPMAERSRVLSRYRPETASFNLGSINFGVFGVLRHGTEGYEPWEVEYLEATRDYVFRNTFADMEGLVPLFRAADARPEYEAYDVGHLYTLRHLADRGLTDGDVHVQFVLGVLGANAARVEQVVHMHRTARDLFGDGFTWSVAGVGYPGEFHVAATALMMGGHVRVSLEDNLRLDGDRRAASNAELVEKVVRLAELLDRRPATPDEARSLLHLKGREAVGFGAAAGA